METLLAILEIVCISVLIEKKLIWNKWVVKKGVTIMFGVSIVSFLWNISINWAAL